MGSLDGMTTPAERYSAARRRAAHPALADFTGEFEFALDEFQLQACRALEDGSGVLVCAPTGAGKTVVGEFAVHLALRQDRKCFYTTPIKALSNQKYNDLVRRYGAANVGLLTGDNAINGDAPVVVMTTEVLRNMLYASSATLAGLGYVVMDEVHYLADRFRGAVWEEVIIHLPESVALVSLSATVSNAEEFADWLVTVRGHTEVVVSEHRPVPLWQHMIVGKRMYDLFASKDSAAQRDVDPELLRETREQVRRLEPLRGRGRGGRPRGLPNRPDVIERLDRDGLLPAITFIFSRAGCDAAVVQCIRAGLRLTSPAEREEIRAIAEQRTSDLSAEDLQVLGYWEWLDGLMRGLAAHHAGMLPVFKEVVEELFVRGLVKAVFATETLALGINMPARSVVLERLVKYNGEAHADITPGEYTQLTGRAGRRGIDIEGHAVVVWSPEIDPRHVAGLASTRTYPLRSSFRPSYNMAVNLVATFGRERARELLETSFAQFQADRAVVGQARQVQRNHEAMAAYAQSMTCHLGDFAEYAALRVRIKERESAIARTGAAQRRAGAAESMEKLKPGDVIRVPTGRRAGFAVVLDPGLQALGDAHPLVLTEDRWAGRLSIADFPDAVEPVGRVKVPRNFNHRNPQGRRDLASSLRAMTGGLGPSRMRRSRSAAADDTELAQLRVELRRHPCHGCDEREDHARWAERYQRLAKDTAALQQRVHNRTGSLARTFDRVCALLEGRGYLTGDTVTPAGTQLSRIWSESDLLVAECLRHEVWAGLSAAELAGAVSVLVYEARRAEDPGAPVPGGGLRDALVATVRLWGELESDESERGLQLTRQPDAGFVWPAYRWARGESLEKVLSSASTADGEMPAGDFVRWCRQVLDLLDQIAGAAGADTTLRSTAREAITAMRRGVIAYSAMA
ncbi:MAG: ATP-dependent helicase HelY [Cryptosporangiaceae bacterium]|nr:ATP-dependent helicase HelY [Cryptosporangiaceae bacterium]MDQ1656101.1 ATP-dependent helicase HelY [Cryptosporangiaceae bacterium]